MAFRKYANAAIIKPDIHLDVWRDLCQRAVPISGLFDRTAARVALQEVDPKQLMLSHCTIVASVNSESSGTSLGKQVCDGFQIDRRYDDYLVTPETTKYLNNNNDGWERKLLLSSFKTFIGGENYCEHIQIPELSKGKIVDAAARDLGDTVYVDILVATDLKHQALVRAIKKGQLQTLSMGCTVEFTLCTKCGNVAYDETQLCPHVHYMKGNTFVDSFGKQRKIAELCGHISAEPGSVRFIEASWVANPAFTGAVLRNILSTDEIAAEGLGKKIQVAFSEGPRVAGADKWLKAANGRRAFGEEDTDVPSGDTPEEKPAEDPLDKAVADLAQLVREKVIERVRGDIGKDEAQKARPLSENLNEGLIKSAAKSPSWRRIARAIYSSTKDRQAAKRILLGLLLFQKGGWRAVQASHALAGRDVLAVSRIIDLAKNRTRMAGEGRIYRVVLAVGDMQRYPDMRSYLAACRRVVGRDLTDSEKDALIDKGRLFALGL
jgi:hypothetical protein